MRLTEKNKMARYGYKYVAPNRFDNFGEGCNKLGQLEDLEEELGVELNVLFEAFKIIKSKNVRIEYIKDPVINEVWDYNDLVATIHNPNGNDLNRDEFELLKEVLL